MLLYITIISFSLKTILCQNIDVLSNILESAQSAIKVIEADIALMEGIVEDLQNDVVKIQVYYECLCPDCRIFDSTSLLDVYEKLHDFLEVRTYPYGNAKTNVHDDGTVDFQCQHGPLECYGNKLHACAISILNNNMKSIPFNACMMDNKNEGKGSDDRAAEKCGMLLKINAEPIKDCAKSKKGEDLLKYFGDESHKVNYSYVPFILINDVEWDQEKEPDFMKSVCAAFRVPPTQCTEDIRFNIIQI
ncbi:hypothetical protein ACJJTC_008725 [Scirpophaga incertulas]